MSIPSPAVIKTDSVTFPDTAYFRKQNIVESGLFGLRSWRRGFPFAVVMPYQEKVLVRSALPFMAAHSLVMECMVPGSLPMYGTTLLENIREQLASFALAFPIAFGLDIRELDSSLLVSMWDIRETFQHRFVMRWSPEGLSFDPDFLPPTPKENTSDPTRLLPGADYLAALFLPFYGKKWGSTPIYRHVCNDSFSIMCAGEDASITGVYDNGILTIEGPGPSDTVIVSDTESALDEFSRHVFYNSTSMPQG